jgi:hypothetical protein
MAGTWRWSDRKLVARTKPLCAWSYISSLFSGGSISTEWNRVVYRRRYSEVALVVLTAIGPWHFEVAVSEPLFPIDQAEAYLRQANHKLERQENVLRWPHCDGVTELRVDPIEHHTDDRLIVSQIVTVEHFSDAIAALDAARAAHLRRSRRRRSIGAPKESLATSPNEAPAQDPKTPDNLPRAKR